MNKYIFSFLLICLTSTMYAQPAFDVSKIKATMDKATFWQLKNPKHKDYDWTNGAFFAGAFAAYETTSNEKIFKAMKDRFDAIDWRPGLRLTHADDHAICQTYIDMARVMESRGENTWHQVNPTRKVFEDLIEFEYVQRERRDNITWWWCDALFMGPPALAKYAHFAKKDHFLAYNDSLFMETYDLLWNEEESLFARDIDYLWTGSEKDKKEANGKKIFWSRGNGWVMGGLVRLLDELPADYPKRAFYENIYKKMAKKIVSIQQEDGLWRASLLDPASYPGGETSGSGFYCYALAWGINNGLLDKSTYEPAVRKAWSSLFDVVQKNGKVGWVQPIGQDPKKNFSKDSWEVYGTGAFLLAGSEMVKLLE
ncbi:MAG: glycoside hydrolase family 88 protein [Bacteroidota bacterium]